MKRVFTPAKKKTILIVDDDQLIVKVYREKLQGHGFRVEVANTGENALQKLEQDPVTLVLLDLCLPGMNGIEVLKDIRSKFPELSVIAFVNPYLTNLTRAALEAGASKCLTKAESMAVFEDLIRPGAIDPQFQRHLAGVVLTNAAETLTKLRAAHQIFARSESEESWLIQLREMHRQVRSFTIAGMAGLLRVSQMTHAFEALLIELQARPQKVTPSVIRTVAQAVDALASLLQQAAKTQMEEPASPKILVVDDEIISRETICSALERAKLSAVSLDDSLAAQRLLEQEHFDLIFLDVEMPGLTGFELCVQIREMETNRATPVVFVTGHSDFASRAQSALSGGNDFITKPFLSGELAVKALSSLFKEKPRASISMPVLPPPIFLQELAHSDSSAI